MHESDRPRERLAASGVGALSAAELLALVLGTGGAGESARDLAERILGSAGGLAPLSRMRVAELVHLPGLGPARASRLAAAFDLGRRALWAGLEPRPILEAPSDVDRFMRPQLAALSQESFWVIALSAKNQVIDAVEVGRGCLTAVEVHPREIFRFLIQVRAAAGIAVHNHPSGDPEPSHEDVLLTDRLVAAGELVGVPLVDHVIVASRGYRSLLAV